jgi:hypothetical protein
MPNPMNKFRFLCPHCGQAFSEGTSFTRCPKCRVALLEAAPTGMADVDTSAMQVDLDALLRRVLAERETGEDIDVALSRVIQREYPESAAQLTRVISQQLDEWQRVQGISREEAAKQLAAAESELVLGRRGTSEVRTEFATEINVNNLDDLSPEQREQVRSLIHQATAEAKPVKGIHFSLSGNKKGGCGLTALLTALVAVAGYVAFV